MNIRQFPGLAAVLILAALLRFTGINWDDNAHLHPDERFLTMVSSAISLPADPLTYLDTASSPANPHNKGFSFYVYGTYPVHMAKFVAGLAKRDTYEGVTIIGRILSATADLMTVVTVYLIAAYITKRHAGGLIAGSIYAVSVLPVQLSHFYTVDPYVTLFTTLALWQLVRGRLGGLLGIAAGLAMAAKISSVILIPVIAVCAVVSWPWKKSASHSRTSLVMSLVYMAVAAAAVLRLAYPYLFSGYGLNQAVLANWKQLASFNEPTTSFPPGLQWIGVGVLQPVYDAVVWGFGLPLGLFVAAAFLSALWTEIRKRRFEPTAVLLLWVILVVGYQAAQFAKPMRYFWPAYPALAVITGSYIHGWLRRASRPLMVGIAGVATLVAMWSVSYLSVYRTPHTRIQASRWIYANAPPNSTVAWEHWDDPIPFALGSVTPLQYKQPQLPVFDPDAPEKWEKISETLSVSDYVVLSSNRGYGAIKRAGKRFPRTVAYYERLFDGSLGFHRVAQFLSRPRIAVPGVSACLNIPGFTYGNLSNTSAICQNDGIYLVDDHADETFTVYDHPPVIIFRNVGRLSRERLYEMLARGK